MIFEIAIVIILLTIYLLLSGLVGYLWISYFKVRRLVDKLEMEKKFFNNQ
jgi:hypothetical protein